MGKMRRKHPYSLGGPLADRDLERARVVGRAASGSSALGSDALGDTLRRRGGIGPKTGKSNSFPLHSSAKVQVSVRLLSNPATDAALDYLQRGLNDRLDERKWSK